LPFPKSAIGHAAAAAAAAAAAVVFVVVVVSFPRVMSSFPQSAVWILHT